MKYPFSKKYEINVNLLSIQIVLKIKKDFRCWNLVSIGFVSIITLSLTYFELVTGHLFWFQTDYWIEYYLYLLSTRMLSKTGPFRLSCSIVGFFVYFRAVLKFTQRAILDVVITHYFKIQIVERKLRYVTLMRKKIEHQHWNLKRNIYHLKRRIFNNLFENLFKIKKIHLFVIWTK